MRCAPNPADGGRLRGINSLIKSIAIEPLVERDEVGDAVAVGVVDDHEVLGGGLVESGQKVGFGVGFGFRGESDPSLVAFADLGGLVGGLLGGKKGVLVGVLAGGGGTFVATKGEEIELPRDTPLDLELRRDLTITMVDSE